MAKTDCLSHERKGALGLAECPSRNSPEVSSASLASSVTSCIGAPTSVGGLKVAIVCKAKINSGIITYREFIMSN